MNQYIEISGTSWFRGDVQRLLRFLRLIDPDRPHRDYAGICRNVSAAAEGRSYNLSLLTYCFIELGLDATYPVEFACGATTNAAAAEAYDAHSDAATTWDPGNAHGAFRRALLVRLIDLLNDKLGAVP